MKVFVSSTFEDLKEHRKAVDEILGRLCQQFSGMEYWGPRPFEPLRASLAEVRQADVFIGIYAHRYGHVPRSHGRSITELEFDLAQELKIPSYCFVVDPTFPWPPHFVEHAARQQIARLLAKVGQLVRAQFTTPDNLAKQVAASVQVAFSAHAATLSLSRLGPLLRDGVGRQIEAGVGPKYIRRLYVPRQVGRRLTRRLQKADEASRLLERVSSDTRSLVKLLESFKPGRDRRELAGDTVNGLRAKLRALKNSHIEKKPLGYPAVQTIVAAEDLRGTLTSLDRWLGEEGSLRQAKTLETRSGALKRLIDELRLSIRPVDVIVDRAGGGKTNLLCRLAEDLGQSLPTFFFPARSVPGPSSSAIADFVRRAFPVSDDPIRTAAEVAAREGCTAVVIVDGINEHTDPLRFNEGLRDFIQTNASAHVRFVVSCRDIYWKYFDDDWWRRHARQLTQGKLYSFRGDEFDQALRLYLAEYDIDSRPVDAAARQLRHPLLLRFYCEAFQGRPGRPAKLGIVRNIRLLDLFETYCDRKFTAIQRRLKLDSVDAVSDFVEALGSLMLSQSTRSVPLKRFAQEAHDVLGDGHVKRLGTRYVEILDEDIIVEERPYGDEMEITVNFVYDEFMEYVIAKRLWRTLQGTGRVRAPKVIESVKELLSQQATFLSVDGVVLYLGCLLARRAPTEGLALVDWLVKHGQESLALGLVERWPSDRSDHRLLARLSSLQSDEQSHVRSEAWEVRCKLSHANWPAFLEHLRRLDMVGELRPAVVFSKVVNELEGGPTAADRLKTLRVIGRMVRLKSKKRRLAESDLEAMATCASGLRRSGQGRWKPSDIAQADKISGEVNSAWQAAVKAGQRASP